MALRPQSLDSSLAALVAAVGSVRAGIAVDEPIARAIDRFTADADAARFHLRRPSDAPLMLAVLGGTGTGKSTVVNRLLDAPAAAPLTAASFRRTYTAGPVAIAHEKSRPPERWLGVEHVVAPADQIPSRGAADVLTIIATANDLVRDVALVDTPDLDGDQPAHHAQADRVFRWADAVLFLVTPEKYQMTELLPYYRLARRYALPALFVMNKAEERAVVEDYAKQLEAGSGSRVPGSAAPETRDPEPGTRLFAIARDDAAYEPPPAMRIEALREMITKLELPASEERTGAAAARVADLLDRFRDQAFQPLRAQRKSVDALAASLRAMNAPVADVDVNPLMVQLRRRLQQRSVLYLIGPGRMLDRVRQVPGLLARLPRTTWDWLRTGELSRNGEGNGPPELEQRGLDFRQALVDQFRVVQARIDDVLRSDANVGKWLDDAQHSFEQAKIDPDQAGAIADEELAELRGWLEKKWNATPRDTALLTKLIKHLPGGEKLTQWSEAAPYLLAAVVATHHAFFGHVDLLILGGYSLATWLTERMSNEVASRARETNRAISRRFAELAQTQINRAIAWLDQRAPSVKSLEELQRLADRVSEVIET
jgi:hypothetical protein